jgi:hypothetical protein
MPTNRQRRTSFLRNAELIQPREEPMLALFRIRLDETCER